MSAEFTEDAEERIREIVREEARHLGLIREQGAPQPPSPTWPPEVISAITKGG